MAATTYSRQQPTVTGGMWFAACGIVCLLIRSVGAVATSPIANPLRVARPPLIL